MTKTRIKSFRTQAALVAPLMIAGLLSAPFCAGAATTPDVSRDNVQWQALGKTENDSMPIGNGDLAANVWTEQNGDLVLLIAKSDAWSELAKLDKVARVRIHLSDNPFAGQGPFTQTLDVKTASIILRSGKNTMTVWVDANKPILHVTGDFVRPTKVEARLELWRNKTHPFTEVSPDRGGNFGIEGFGPTPPPIPIDWAADTVLPAAGGKLTWYHLNTQSLYPVVLKEQHLEQLADKYPDPLLGRIFGGTLSGVGLIAKDDHTLVSAAALKTVRIDLVALTTSTPDTAETWRQKVEAIGKSDSTAPLSAAWQKHTAWWQAFWNRSWIQVDGSEEARKVEQGYLMQRYMMATSSRGAYPAKFNGGLFTVGGDMPDGVLSDQKQHSPDFRQWGGSYWNQNNRHMYWPLVASGDLDVLKPWFDLYVNALPLAKDRTEIYYHHKGAAFIETIDFWGLPTLNDFGWNNPGVEVSSPFMRYHTQGNIEVLVQMLDAYDVSQDQDFARKDMVPFADAVLDYYGQHWKGVDANGKISFSPSQSIETYQLDAVNPTPDIAGLYYVIQRIQTLPDTLATPAQKASWQALRDRLPPIPMGTTHDGKSPPNGHGDASGTPIILPAQAYGATKNIENPELYTVFPYRIYGIGKPDLKLARDTFNARLFPIDYCWGQDGEEAALLGLTDEARKVVVKELTNYGTQRFKWFWDKGMDWTPDMDNGGAGMATLQYMLMQTDGRKIQLIPAWPKDWTADFKLHAPYQTTVEGHVENGRVTKLKVTPVERSKDVVIVAQDGD